MKIRFLSSLALACVLAAGCASVPVITQTQAASASSSAQAGEAAAEVASGSDGSAATEGADGTTIASQAPAEPAAAPAVPDIARDQAIAQLSEVAFLSFGDASCVIDALHEEVGIYNFASPTALEQADQPALIEMCMNGQTPSAASSVGTSADDAQADDAAPTTETKQLDPPLLIAGSTSSGSVVLAGRTVPYAVITPEGFQIGDAAPVFIALSGDEQSVAETVEYYDSIFGEAVSQRGWVMVTPAAVAGTWHDGRNAQVMPELIDWIETWVSVTGRPHLGGSRNGGAAAFERAMERPEAFQSLMIFPGLLPAQLNGSLSSLAGLPVRMWGINSTTSPWVPGMIEAEAALVNAGVDVVLRVVELEELVNVTDLTYGGWIFDELDAAR